MQEFKVYEGIIQGLEEAIEYKKGNRSKGRVSVREIPVFDYMPSDITRIRLKLNLSQRNMAKVLGVSPRTVEAWEAGRNRISGTAKNLLYLIDSDNSLVNKLVEYKSQNGISQ
ncbi:MAG: helix-turn-helix domain-containing protein [Papillibacter sp.]|jgi:putative transcriptional regulator|nr:helix-turn-helix domain-containing protein [Papillibacter sp.]